MILNAWMEQNATGDHLTQNVASTEWVLAPASGVLDFAIENPHDDGVVLVNGTAYRELTYKQCACTQHFALPVSHAGWYSIQSAHGIVVDATWKIGEWSASRFRRIVGCSSLKRLYAVDRKSVVHVVIRPCVGTVSINNDASTKTTACKSTHVVEAGAGYVSWEACLSADPYRDDGYKSGMQFAAWVYPYYNNQDDDAAAVQNDLAKLSSGTLTVVLDAQEEHDTEFWVLST